MSPSRAIFRRVARRALREARKRARRPAVNRAFGAAQAPYKLHVGCGSVNLAGWVNVDSERLATVDLLWDLRWGVPAPDASCAFIYSEHVLEHFTVDDGLALLRDCHRALQPGGVLRIAMPSLDFILERATSPDWRDQDWLTWPSYRSIATRAEMLNAAFRNWDHRYLYDREELHRRLREAGFRTIADAANGESEHAELRALETRKDSLLICEATKS